MRNLKWMMVGIVVIALVILWVLFIRYEKIERQEDFSGEGMSHVQLRVQDVDLVLEESKDENIHAALIGEKARADLWTLELHAEGTKLTIESVFKQKAYLNIKDRPQRQLVVRLPKKAYDSLRLIESSGWRNAAFSIPDPNGTRQVWSAANLKGRQELATAFGPLVLSK